MQISLTHTIQGVCCADMTCLWCLRTVMFSFCGYFCLFPVSSEDNGLGSILSVLIRCLCTTITRSDQIYYSNACKFIYFKSSVHVTFLLACKQAWYSLMSMRCLLWQLCVLHYCVSPSPTLNPCGNILNAQKYKTLIWTGKSGNMAFQWRGKRLVTMFLKIVPGNHSMFTEASFLSLSSSSK